MRTLFAGLDVLFRHTASHTGGRPVVTIRLHTATVSPSSGWWSSIIIASFRWALYNEVQGQMTAQAQGQQKGHTRRFREADSGQDRIRKKDRTLMKYIRILIMRLALISALPLRRTGSTPQSRSERLRLFQPTRPTPPAPASCAGNTDCLANVPIGPGCQPLFTVGHGRIVTANAGTQQHTSLLALETVGEPRHPGRRHTAARIQANVVQITRSPLMTMAVTGRIPCALRSAATYAVLFNVSPTTIGQPWGVMSGNLAGAAPTNTGIVGASIT